MNLEMNLRKWLDIHFQKVCIAVLCVVTLLLKWMMTGEGGRLTVLSYCFEIGSVCIVYAIAKELKVKKPKDILIALMYMCLPNVLMTGAWLQQKDAVYIFFAWAVVYSVMKNHMLLACILFTAGFICQMEMLFLLPFLILSCVAFHRGRWQYFLVIPTGGLLSVGVCRLLGIPWRQALPLVQKIIPEGEELYASGPTALVWLPEESELLVIFSMIVLIAMFLAAGLWLTHISYGNSPSNLLRLAMWSSFSCYLLTPKMLEKDTYLPIVLMSVYYACTSLKKIWMPIAGNIIVLICYDSGLFGGRGIDIKWLALFMLILYGLATYDMMHVRKIPDRE